MYQMVMPSSVDAGLIQALIAVVIFGFGMIVSWLVWLTLRHYQYAKPAHDFLTGDTGFGEEGHVEESRGRFDEIEEAHTTLSKDVETVRERVAKVDRNQSKVISNQERIAEGIGVDLNTDFVRGGGRSTGDDD